MKCILGSKNLVLILLLGGFWKPLAHTRTFTVEIPGFSKIPGGTFTMGNNPGETDSWAAPHYVTVSPFSMKTSEVTLSEWQHVRTWGLQNGYTSLPQGEGVSSSHPVHSITWMDAVIWCNAFSQMNGLVPCYTDIGGQILRYQTATPVCRWDVDGVRLPTEAEWEIAARGGTDRRKFPSGRDTISRADANYTVWTYTNTNPFPYDQAFDPNIETGHDRRFGVSGAPYTCPVFYFPPNPFGLYGMAGNVSEWCWDWHTTNYYDQSNSSTDPTGPTEASSRVNKTLRGGGWNTYASMLRTSARAYQRPERRDDYIGFRLVNRPKSFSLIAAIPSMPPQIGGAFATNVSSSEATVGGDVTHDGNATITERGIVYSNAHSEAFPEIGKLGVVKVVVNGTAGPFSVILTDLAPDTTYNFRAYAINRKGVSYTHVSAFTTIGVDLGGGKEAEVMDPLPDLSIGESAIRMRGANIFSVIGQRLTLSNESARGVNAYVGVSNRGIMADTFVIYGDSGSKNFTVSYHDRSGLITSKVSAGSYKTSEMSPMGDGEYLQIRVRRARTFKTGGGGQRGLDLKVTGTSVLKPTAKDSVFLRVNAR